MVKDLVFVLDEERVRGVKWIVMVVSSKQV